MKFNFPDYVRRSFILRETLQLSQRQFTERNKKKRFVLAPNRTDVNGNRNDIINGVSLRLNLSQSMLESGKIFPIGAIRYTRCFEPIGIPQVFYVVTRPIVFIAKTNDPIFCNSFIFKTAKYIKF